MRTCFFLGLLLLVAGCGKAQQAAELAEFSVYYARLGTELNEVEQGFQEIAPRISAAVMNRGEQPAVLASLEEHVRKLDAVVQRSQPSNPAAHGGHQAAVRMIQRRTAAIATLRQAWAAAADTEAASNAMQPFMSEWMAAQMDFMNAAGQASQQVFGAAAGQAAQATGAPSGAPAPSP